MAVKGYSIEATSEDANRTCSADVVYPFSRLIVTVSLDAYFVVTSSV